MSECQKCFAAMSIRDGEDPTDYCDQCAHELLSRIRGLLESEKLAEILYSLDDSYLSKWSELADKHYIRDRFRAAAEKLREYLLPQLAEKEK